MLSKEQLDKINYINLVAKTHYSIPFGVGKVKDQISSAAKKGHQGIAIVDDFAMNGILEAYSLSKDKDYIAKLKKEKFSIVLGTKINLTDNLELNDSSVFNISIYAKNWTGYKNMTYLTSLSSMPGNGFVNSENVLTKRISFENLAERSEGLIIGSGDIDGILSQSIIKGNGQEEDLIQIFKEIFGDSFFIEIHYHPKTKFWNKAAKAYQEQTDDVQKIVNLELIKLAKKHNVKCCLVQNSYMHDKKYDYIQNILISNHKDFKKDGYFIDVPKYMMTVEEMYQYVQKNASYISDEEFVEFCENSIYFADLCKDIYLEFEPALPYIDYKLHPVNLPENAEKYEKLFHEYWAKVGLICPAMGEIFKIAHIRNDEALKTSLKALIRLEKMEWENIEWLDRLAIEIKVLTRNGVLNLLDYFLLLEDVTNFLRDIGKLRGFGRGCKTEDCLVLTRDSGYKKIIDIKVGDYVFSHKGKARKVLKTHKYSTLKNEKLLKIFTERYFNPISLTPDHKIYGIKREYNPEFLRRKKEGKTYKKLKVYQDIDLSSLDFDHAKNFKPGDLLFVKNPEQRKIIDFKEIDLIKESKLDWKINFKKKGKKIKYIKSNDSRISESFVSKIKVDEDFCYILGKWIGDGHYSINKNMLTIDFNSNDKSEIDKTFKYFKKLGFHTRLYKSKNSNLMRLHVMNPLLTHAFKNLFPNYKLTSKTKYIGKFKYLPDNKLKSLLLGLKSADGSEQNIKGGDRRENIDTTSPQLRNDVRECLTYLNIPSTIKVRKAYKDKRFNGINSESYKIDFIGLNLKRIDKLYNLQKDGYFVKIKEIKNEKAPKFVYDLTVDMDNSFLTSEFTSHNSGGGSLLTYVMDVSDVQPLKYNLLFERFFTQDKIGVQYHEIENYPLSEYSTGKLKDIDEVILELDNLKKLFNNKKLKDVNQESLHRELYYIECNDELIKYYQNVAKKTTTDNVKLENKNDSTLAYLLDVTDSLPKKFIKHSEPSMPDFDYDTDGRDEVKAYLTKKNGYKHTTLIGTLGSLKTKGAVKDVIRQLRPDMDVTKEVNPLTEKFNVIKTTDEEKIRDTLQLAMAQKNIDYSGIDFKSELAYFYACLEAEPKLNEWFSQNQNVKDAVVLLLGNAKGTGVHAGGIVVSRKEIMELCPLTWSYDENIWVTQYEMTYVEKAGLIKYDFLGLSTLQDFNRVLKLINSRYPEKIVLSKIPMDDKVIFDLFIQGKTESVFQFNGPLPISILTQLKEIRGIDDLAMITSIARPGPLAMGMDRTFIRRNTGEDPIEYLHPSLQQILQETYALLVYQEQVMLVAKYIGELDSIDSVKFMKALSKKKPEAVAKLIDKINKTATTKYNFKPEVAKELMDTMQAFSLYAFNKSHAAAYACVSYLCMWFKHYYPAEWISAVLSGAKKEDLEILYPKWKDYIVPPSINQSKDSFQINEDNKVVMPFNAVNGIGEKAVIEIIKKQPYASFEDFMNRVDLGVVNKTSVLAMIFTGIFDSFKPDEETSQRWRKILVRDYFKLKFALAEKRTGKKTSKKDIEEAKKFFEDEVVKMNRSAILMKEISLLNFTAFDYYDYYRREMTDGARVKFGKQAIRPGEVQKYPTDSTVVVGGMIEDIEFKRTKKGGEMAVLKLSNDGHTLDVMIFGRQIEEDDASESKMIRNLKKYMPIIIKGKVNRWNGRLSLVWGDAHILL